MRYNHSQIFDFITTKNSSRLNLFILMIYVTAICFVGRCQGQLFDPDLWKKDTIGFNGYRSTVIDTVEKIKGVTEDSLYQILGQPDFYAFKTEDIKSSLDFICMEGKKVVYLYENYLYREEYEYHVLNQPLEMNQYTSSYLVFCISEDKVLYCFNFFRCS